METLLSSRAEVTESALVAIAHMPTASLPVLMDDAFVQRLSDADFMRIAVLLAQKSFDEGGCPIGAVIIDNATRRILGKGHNTLVQENHPYNHGETSAIRDAGRLERFEDDAQRGELRDLWIGDDQGSPDLQSGEIEADFPQRLVGVGGIHLVGLLVGLAQRLCRADRVPKRAVKARCVLRGVRHDPRVDVAGLLERGADAPDAAVHHVRRRDDVDARLVQDAPESPVGGVAAVEARRKSRVMPVRQDTKLGVCSQIIF